MRDGRPLNQREIHLRQGESFHFDKRIVLPDDDRIRPTTSHKSKTGIRVEHKLALSLVCTPLPFPGAQSGGTGSEYKTKEVHILAPATLSACCCVIEALQLPAYGEDAELKKHNQMACDERAKDCE